MKDLVGLTEEAKASIESGEVGRLVRCSFHARFGPCGRAPRYELRRGNLRIPACRRCVRVALLPWKGRPVAEKPYLAVEVVKPLAGDDGVERTQRWWAKIGLSVGRPQKDRRDGRKYARRKGR